MKIEQRHVDWAMKIMSEGDIFSRPTSCLVRAIAEYEQEIINNFLAKLPVLHPKPN